MGFFSLGFGACVGEMSMTPMAAASVKLLNLAETNYVSSVSGGSFGSSSRFGWTSFIDKIFEEII